MVKWEYKYFNLKYDILGGVLEARLNELGDEGWGMIEPPQPKLNQEERTYKDNQTGDEKSYWEKVMYWEWLMKRPKEDA